MNQKIVMIFSMALIAIGLLPTRSQAIDWKRQEDIGLESTWAICFSSTVASGPRLCGSATATVSTFTIPGWMIGYQFYTLGGGGQYNIQTSTDNWDVSGNTTYDFYTSSTVYISTAVVLTTDVKGQMYNSKLNFTQLDNGASAYLRIEYLTPRQKGQP